MPLVRPISPWRLPALRFLAVASSFFATATFAEYAPWVRSISVAGDQQFVIYDRLAQAVVENPVYLRQSPTTDPVSQPSGVVHSSSLSFSVDLDGQVPVGNPILVRVTPQGTANGSPFLFSPASQTVLVSSWADPDDIPFAFTGPYGIGQPVIAVQWTLETSDDEGVTWTVEVGDQSTQVLYTTLAMPIITGTYQGQRRERGNPWIDTLDRSTRFAAGLDTDDAVMRALARRFWANSEHIYDGGAHSTPTDYNTLNLERFLNPSIDIQADCRDMSNFLALLGRSLGLNVTTFRIRGGVSVPAAFWVQYLGPHGGHQPAFIINSLGQLRFTTPPVHAWTQTRWNYHQVAFYNGNLFDSAAMIELDPFVPRNPSNIINHRDLREADAQRLGYEYIPDGTYVPNGPAFLEGGDYNYYQPYLVLNESPFVSSSHIEQQGAPPIVR
jgi:hypothetical protein